QIDRHSDHGKASDLIYDACFISGLSKLKTSFEGSNQDPWRPKINLNYQQWNDFDPDVLIDVTNYMETKIESILSYKSQVIKNHTSKSTKINSENFIDSISYRSKNYGRLIDVDYAEAFQSRRNIGINDISDLI
ncbi:bacillithiol biosynthesis deacetylase BshB1, partial [Flavobacteriaceae bacterium]|nr:bacillithiol biosynthesis deacetylase BshB1 [Flavobacteriaceae bacterium]